MAIAARIADAAVGKILEVDAGFGAGRGMGTPEDKPKGATW